MAWFRKDKKPLKREDRRDVPTDVFDKCDGCGEILYTENVAQNANVCPDCGFHFKLPVEKYIELLLDEGSFEEMDAHLRSADPLGFEDLKKYSDRIVAAEKKVGRNDAIVSGVGSLGGHPVAVAFMDFRFIGGSMGSVVGERLTRLIERATEQNLPLIIVSGSGGGARMHEGILSLMQMAKVSAALARYDEAGGLYISVLTHPTMGGVAASFALLGDVVFAEPKALIGFAGPRTIKATIRLELPEGFQTSEFLLQHGYVDRIVRRPNLKSEIARTIDYCGK